ncbi:hypothetical protein [Streptomyces phage phiScoe25]|nr:hypothetical protein [Streptomyces phage phiScoe25]
MIKVSYREFAAALSSARSQSSLIADATSDPSEFPSSYAFYLSEDGLSGLGVAGDGTLVGVFSLVKGRGEDMIWEAILHYGADRLDCFDGFLPDYYKRFGFAEYERVANWTAGEPDVVFMRLTV